MTELSAEQLVEIMRDRQVRFSATVQDFVERTFEHVTLSEGCDVCEAPRQYLPHGDSL